MRVPLWDLAVPAAWALRQEGWAVLWWAISQVQADIRLTQGSLVGFGRLLQFGANAEVLGRSAVS